MNDKKLLTLFIFRRDLRCHDNKGLLHAMKYYENVIPIFIYTKEQVTTKNMYRSKNAIQFMNESLHDLNENLKTYGSRLHLCYGDNISILESIIKEKSIRAIVCNEDYTPYAIQRDKKISNICNKNGIEFVKVEDYLLSDICSFLKGDGEPYHVFTPFKNNVLAQENAIDRPVKMNTSVLFSKLTHTNISCETKINQIKDIQFINPSILVHGGRKNGLRILSNINKFKDYNNKRSALSYNTSHLSAYIKFGCVSIREIYWGIRKHFKKTDEILSQLIWREFYYYIGYYYPDVLKGKNFQTKWKHIKWKRSKNEFDAWCKGITGFPIVDAGMRELNTTGYMHNRCRLITSNFLNRILGQDWRKGERYFATKLIDYDPFVNNGNWQWIASTGTDTSPYSQRIFNPYLQSERYDPDCKYIKKWVPELKNVRNLHIHQWDDYCDEEENENVKYPRPIVDYSRRRQESLNMYKNAL